MTDREAIDVLKVLKAVCEETFGEGEAEALQMAIDALNRHGEQTARILDSMHEKGTSVIRVGI